MSYFSGQNGQLFIQPAGTGSLQDVGSLRNWTLNCQMPVLDTTTMCDTDRTILPGVRSFTGQATLLYYAEKSSNVRLMTQDFVYGKKTSSVGYQSDTFGKNAAPNASYITLRLWDGKTRDIKFYCYITSFNISCAVGEVVSSEIAWEGHGIIDNMGMIE